MESSKFIQLSPKILVEYVYTDQTNPTVFNTGSYPIEILYNEYEPSYNFYNTDTVASTMGNYRDISTAAIDQALVYNVSLNTSLGVPYNDYDNNLTNSNQLLQSFSPNIDIEYDKVRIHFISGFDFDDYDGIIFNLNTVSRDGTTINLSSIRHLKTSTPKLHADPLLISDKLYATYIEWYLPSVYYMHANFSSINTNSLGYKLTDGKGFRSNPVINIQALGIFETVVENSYSFYAVEQINSTSILNRDVYDDLYASVKESDNGDYFELTGLVNGSSLANYIFSLNSTGGDYIVLHEISISEQIEYNFVQTSNQIITQTGDFDTPVIFRPIILNSSKAVSFAINYVLRLFDRSNNTQIIKNARLISNDVKKYGRRLLKINLGTVPTVATVVNQLNKNDGSNINVSTGSSSVVGAGSISEKVVEKLVVKTNYVTSFKDRINIKAAISPVKIQNIEE